MSNGYSTTVYPNGVTNAPVGTALQTYPADDPTVLHTYFNDFDVYTAGDWTNTATGSVTNAIAAGDGGWLSLANSAANADLNSLQLKVATFAITPGKEAWCKVRFKTSNATNAALIIGLIQTTTTPLTVTNGIYFSKAAASTSLLVKAAASSAITTSSSIGTMADDTFVTAGWHYNGGSLIQLYFNGNRVASIPTTNLPSSALNLTIAESNGTAAAITTTVDYILCSTERPAANV